MVRRYVAGFPALNCLFVCCCCCCCCFVVVVVFGGKGWVGCGGRGSDTTVFFKKSREQMLNTDGNWKYILNYYC